MATSPQHIAVVDDEESIGRALRRLMRAAGFEVETYSSGAEFLRAIENSKPDCVVLDLHMPEMSGFEVQARLAAMESPPPVVIITGRDSDEAREQAMAAHPAAYLRKPIDERVLLEAVQAAITNELGAE